MQLFASTWQSRRGRARISCALACFSLLSLGAALPAAAKKSAKAEKPAAAATDAGTPQKLSVPYEKFTLPNGLTVILHEDHSIPRVSVNTWYHVGSAREKLGRTGFAHLFEHLMFEGSGHVKEGEFDTLLESVGGDNNGSTTEDRTNYWEEVPSNAVEMPLFLESDRMAYLLDTMSPERVNGQRDIVKNERRQSYENQPYGVAELMLPELLFPKGHPYSWTVIGSMEDLTAASYQDVVDFFKQYYGPNNASIVIAGDIDPKKVRAAVEKWFADVPRGKEVPKLSVPPATLDAPVYRIFEDNKAELPLLRLAWITPAAMTPEQHSVDILSNVLANGKNSRLYQRLVHELQIAQDVSAHNSAQPLSGYFVLDVMAMPGENLQNILKIVDEEIKKLATEAPQEREVARIKNRIETDFYDQLEDVSGFGGRADMLNQYFVYTGNPDFFAEDLARYQAVTPNDVKNAAQKYLTKNRVVMSVVKAEQKNLAVPVPTNKVPAKTPAPKK